MVGTQSTRIPLLQIISARHPRPSNLTVLCSCRHVEVVDVYGCGCVMCCGARGVVMLLLVSGM